MGKGNNYRDRDRRGGGGSRDFDDQPSFGYQAPRPHDSRTAGPFRPSPRPSFAAAPEGPAEDATVKWYNPSKGFGFVELASGGDAFLHASCVESAGHETVAPGTRIQVQVTQGQKGKQVSRLVSVDAASAPAVSQRSGAFRPERSGGFGSERPGGFSGAPRAPLQASETVTGTVKWFDSVKGYGFVQDDAGGKDVFVHLRAIREAGLQTINEGQRVTLGVAVAPKGREAVTLSLA